MITSAFKTEEEYRNYHAINFSSLASYWHEGIYSPDHALMPFAFKSYFEYGKMFETLLEDTVKGTKEFEKRYFISGVDGNIPDKLINWIDNNEDLESKIITNKDGSRSKTAKSTHLFIDECLNNPEKIPTSIHFAEMLKMHVERMCKMKLIGASVGDILAKAEWQVSIKWKDDTGIEKKGLIDCLLDLGGEYLMMDIKTAAQEARFGRMLNTKYWIQDLHYSEGVETSIGPLASEQMQMLFLVAYKEKPYLTQPVTIDYGGIDHKILAIEEYQALCQSYNKWDKKPKGWLPMKTNKFYLRS